MASEEYKSDIEIARAAEMHPIIALAEEKLGLRAAQLEPFGHYKAKVSLDVLAERQDKPDGKLILVTAMTPTPAGEGKTTTTVGLGDALTRIGKRAMICLREPSLGPCFGMKGGAAGGGYAQVVPMEDINLHFTGDFHAIGAAHNLLSAMIDNHVYWGNDLDIDTRRISWRRVVDMNDRALRAITVGQGGVANGFTHEGGYDITVASEVMAILCLAEGLDDLKTRLGNIVVAQTRARKPVSAREIGAHGAMATLLKDAVKPNLVQTLEHTLALIHGGPFANIAHGCNSVLATKTALKLADYVVTEAGFGADLGAEKFLDIKCRKAGLTPAAAVVVATVRALKMHGGVARDALAAEDVAAVTKGGSNLARHVENVRGYGLPVVVAINRFPGDSEAEIAAVRAICDAQDVQVVLAEHWAHGGAGAEDLAKAVVGIIEAQPSRFKPLYEDSLSLWDKTETIAQKIYRGRGIVADKKVRAQFAALQEGGYGHYPVCIAKTQYSFSTDPLLKGAPVDHVVPVREIRLASGAEFVVVVCGDIMTMPGLPRRPAAEGISVDGDGVIDGLF
ncbi:MAG: formate--tetrahydrofolate ligase [Alphaproteobacteria bacterium]